MERGSNAQLILLNFMGQSRWAFRCPPVLSQQEGFRDTLFYRRWGRVNCGMRLWVQKGLFCTHFYSMEAAMSLIQIKNLTFAYDGTDDTIFENASFQIDTDWRIGCFGRNGRGKTTFLQLLMKNHAYSGSISKSVSFDYFPYTVADAAVDTLSVVESVTGVPFWQIQRELSYLDMPEEILYQPFETLSCGEQTKVLLAALFLKEGRFLLIDEPTNHLDLVGRKAVEKYLSRKKGFILVSHDRYLLDGCVDHILSMEKNGIKVQKGNFSSWWENKERKDQYELAENEKRKREMQALTEAARRTAAWADKVERSKYQPLDSGLSPDRGYIGHKAAKMMQRSKAAERRIKRAAEEKACLLKNIENAENLRLTALHYHKDVLVRLQDLSVSYGDRPICGGISFEIQQGNVSLCRVQTGVEKAV